MTVVPADLRGFPVAKCTCNDLNGNIVHADILKEQWYGYRLHSGDMTANSRSPDTESANIGTDVKDPVIGPDIVEPVLGHRGYLAIGHGCSGENDIRFFREERVGWHPGTFTYRIMPFF